MKISNTKKILFAYIYSYNVHLTNVKKILVPAERFKTDNLYNLQLLLILFTNNEI